VGIHKFIGRRPILAFGNSDGDQQMLEWTDAGSGARFMGLVHHTDAEREWAYDRGEEGSLSFYLEGQARKDRFGGRRLRQQLPLAKRPSGGGGS